MIVLDTHAVAWWLQGSARLTNLARDVIEREPRVIIPDIVCWEMALLVRRGRVRFSIPSDDLLRDLFREPGIVNQSITPEIGRRAAELIAPNLALDPGDRLIAATALELDCPLVTADERLKSLPGLRTLC